MRGEPCGHDGHQAGERITPAYAGRTPVPPAKQSAAADHPRVCGENSGCPRMTAARRGSPPRMRGEPSSVPRAWVWLRITPAYAGRTRVSLGSIGFFPDHPRVCGENGEQATRNLCTRGSPPRMRGEQAAQWVGEADVGITPAYAGRTSWQTILRLRRTDHPRVCGENWSITRLSGIVIGSPPRMRGEPASNNLTGRIPRITPAYAGRTRSSRGACGKDWDHPRVCGENTKAAQGDNATPGSPPRMRGEPCRGDAGQLQRGITPAYAGRTAHQSHLVAGTEDHPRVCGENHPAQSGEPPTNGSPPRMRGELETAKNEINTSGITPAYAGRTPGEMTPMPATAGSPPRMRGERRRPRANAMPTRITPAYAGRTSRHSPDC